AGQSVLERWHRLGVEVDDDCSVIFATRLRGHGDDRNVVRLQSVEAIGDLDEFTRRELRIVLNARGEMSEHGRALVRVFDQPARLKPLNERTHDPTLVTGSRLA